MESVVRIKRREKRDKWATPEPSEGEEGRERAREYS